MDRKILEYVASVIVFMLVLFYSFQLTALEFMSIGVLTLVLLAVVSVYNHKDYSDKLKWATREVQIEALVTLIFMLFLAFFPANLVLASMVMGLFTFTLIDGVVTFIRLKIVD